MPSVAFLYVSYTDNRCAECRYAQYHVAYNGSPDPATGTSRDYTIGLGDTVVRIRLSKIVLLDGFNISNFTFNYF